MRSLPGYYQPSWRNIQECSAVAKNAGAKYFGLQAGDPKTGSGQCFYGNDLTTVNNYGLYDGTPKTGLPPDVSARKPITAPGTQSGVYMGGTWSNAVYSL